jgi:DNA polymerase-3 subunit delta
VHISDLIRSAQTGHFGVAHLLVGEERFFIDRAVRALRNAAIGDGPSGFNDEIIECKGRAKGKDDEKDEDEPVEIKGKGTGETAKRILEAANTLPMMARTRFVLVRRVDFLGSADLNGLATYLDAPSDTTCLVLTAEKIDGRSKLAALAKKKGYWCDASALKSGEIRSFIGGEAKARGTKIDATAVAAISDALGTDLAAIDDALERLSLYVGASGVIDAAAVEACVTRIRVDTIWSLVDAVGLRDGRKALTAAGSLLADREPPLKILSLIARQLRMVARMRHALQNGHSADDAARTAGAPPFKARELATAAKRFSNRDLAAAFAVLAETDLALKGSRVPPGTVLEAALLRLCEPAL